MTTAANAVIVKRVKDADGAVCRDCKAHFDDFTNQTVPWDWRKSQLIHQRATGHKMDMFCWNLGV